MGGILAEGTRWPAGASPLLDRRTQPVDQGGEILLVQPRAGERGITLRRLLRVAFGRWSVESCFRQAKEELGLDHYEVRGWRCLHRHFYLTQMSHLFCARMRFKFDDAATSANPLERLTTEQVRRALNAWLEVAVTRRTRENHLQRELAKQQYYQRRNAQARRSHTKTRKALLRSLGIDADRIKSCIPRSTT
jgi:hypothetical protein